MHQWLSNTPDISNRKVTLLSIVGFVFLLAFALWFYLDNISPSKGVDLPIDGTVTLAFEDKKQEPDYDYNDFVVEIQINEFFTSDQLQKVTLHIKPKAKMGGYTSSFFLKLSTPQGTAFSGGYKGLMTTRMAGSMTGRSETFSSLEKPIVIFSDTATAISQGLEVDLELQIQNPELNLRKAMASDPYSRYIFGLDVTDKYQNNYQVEYINKGLNQENATQRPLSILIPIKNWRIPKERTSSYLVYADLTQHINYIRGLVSKDKPKWYEKVTDESLIETENFLFKKKKSAP